MALVAGIALAGAVRTDIEIQEVRNPIKLRQILNDNFASTAVNTGATTRVTALEANTNANAGAVAKVAAGHTGSFQFMKPGGTTGTVYMASGIVTNSP